MLVTEQVIGDWDALCARVDNGDRLTAWSAREPALRQAACAGQLRTMIAAADPVRADAVLGALLRLASVRCGGDDEALLVLLHMLRPGIERAALRLRPLTGQPVPLLVGELTMGIRQYGVPGPRGGGQRERAFAANLLRDAEHAVRRELRTNGTGAREVLVDPTNPAGAYLLNRPAPEPERRSEEELAEFLIWAEQTKAAARRDLSALVDGEASRERGAASARQPQIAAGLYIAPATLRRRRDRALSALKSAAPAYQRRQA